MVVHEDSFEIVTDPSVHMDVHTALVDAGYELVESDIDMVPSMEATPTSPEDIKKLAKMIDVLEDNDDVNNVWHSWEMPEEDEED